MRFRLVTVVSVMLLVVLLVSVLPACAPKPTAAPPTSAPEAGKKQIKAGNLEVGVLWQEGSPWFDHVKEIGDSMERDFPGTKVTYTFNNTDARPAIEARMQAGDPLDIDFIFEGMDPNTYSWVEGGYIMDITDAMNEKRADGTTWKDDFLPLFMPSMEYKGRIYGAGEQVFIIILHYNKKMFDEWGLTPPKTWDELLQTCETIKSKGVAPIAVTGLENYYVGMWSDYLFQRIMGSEKIMKYLYEDTDMKLSGDPDALKALEEMNKLVKNGYLIDGWQSTDFTTSQVYFFQGKAAMILMGSWLMTEMKASIPEGFQLAVAPFPKFEGGKGRQDAIFGRVLSWNVPSKTDVPDLAVEFLRRFTSKEAATKRALQLDEVSVLKGVPAPPGIGGIEKMLEEAANAEFIMYHWGTLSAKFGLQSAWFDPVVQMWVGQLTPEQALAKLDANLESIRAQRKASK